MHDLVLLALLVLYASWDYVLGFLVTQLLAKVLFTARYLDLPSFAWSFEWIAISFGVTECRVAVGTFRWANPPKHRVHPFFLELKRVELRFDARPTLRWLAGRLGVGVVPVPPSGASQGAPVTTTTPKRPIYAVASLEVEGVTINLERKNGKLNLWGALGMTEDEVLTRAEAQRCDVDDEDRGDHDDDAAAAAFEEVDEPAASAEEEEPQQQSKRHWSKFLGEFAVERATIRSVKSRVEAFVRPSDTTAVCEDPVKIRCIDMTKRALRPQKLTKKKLASGNRRQGLFLDELIWRLIWRVTHEVWRAPQVASLAGKIAKDHSKAAVKSTGKTIQSLVLNATHPTRQHERRDGAHAAATGAGSSSRSLSSSTTESGGAGVETLRVRVHDGKHLATDKLKKPSTYVKLAVGKTGAKAKSPVVAGTRNPEFDFAVDLPVPMTCVGDDPDLRVQVVHRPMLAGRETRLFPTLKIPLADVRLAPGRAIHATWYDFAIHGPPEDDDDDEDAAARREVVEMATTAVLKGFSKLPSVRLSLALLPASR